MNWNLKVKTMKRIIVVLIGLLLTTWVLAQDEEPERDDPETEPEEEIVEERPEIDEEDEEYRESEYKRWQRRKRQGEIKTIAGGKYHSGGFGAVSFRSSQFQGSTLVFAGARGGWIINRTVAIGFEGHGIIPTAKFDNVVPGEEAVLLGGYGGLFIEPIILSNEMVHLTFPVSAGAGWLGFHEDWSQNSGFDTTDNLIEDDVFWYIEPGAAVEVNVSKNFRMAVGVSKRFTQDLELINAIPNDFEELNYFLTLKFGKF